MKVRSKNNGTLAAQTAIVHNKCLLCSRLNFTNVSGRIFIIPLNNRTPKIKPATIVMIRAIRSELNGLHKRNSIIKPTNVIDITDMVDISTIGMSKFLYNTKIAVRAAKLASPAGIAF